MSISITRTQNDGFNPVIISFTDPKKFLLIPIEELAPESKFIVIGKDNRYIFNIRLSITKIDYYVPLTLQGDTHIEIYKAPKSDAIGWSRLELSDSFDDSDHEYYRQIYHFCPKYGWMNDPNGLFYKDGVYHAYYQYNPYASVWGNMHWGHTTTKDFVHYEHHPVVMIPDEIGAIFSGSIVIDQDNVSGFGKDAVIAYYTSATREDYTGQTQCMAISTDGGYTFKKYEQNPIITYDCRDFRDPIVIRYKNQWNMFVSTQQWVRIYSSQNLKEWKFESEFGHGIGSHDGCWECPTVFEINGKWVMIVSMNKGADVGNAMQYYIGTFDGHEFRSEYPPRVIKWMDFGLDSFATACFHNAPALTAISWMRYNEFDRPEPTKQFRGCFTVPRTFTVHECPKTHLSTLYSIPLPSFEAQFSKVVDKITPACFVEIELTNVTAKYIYITLKNNHEHVDMEINRNNDGYFFFSRGIRSGLHDFGDHFCNTDKAPYFNKDHYKLKLFIDKHSIEIFDAEGEISLTETVFPRSPYTDLVIDPIDGEAQHKITIKTL